MTNYDRLYRVTETVYRKQIRPVIQKGAIAMNDIFPADSEP